MAVVARSYGGRTDPLYPLSQASHAAPGFGKGKGASVHYQVDDGLAISYDQYDQRPSYHPDGGHDYVGFGQNEVPVARNKPDTVFLSAYDPQYDRSNRIDSVFDVYADMYAEDDDDDDDDEDGADELQRGTNGRGVRREERSPYEADLQPTEPWDERGKTGLYGGGGRGADDRETGWVSNYAFASFPSISGYEEDLRFDGEVGDEQVGPKSRLGSRATQGSRSRDPDGIRDESTDGPPSSMGPNTPPETNTHPSPSSPTRQTRTEPRVTAPLSPPIHTIDATRIKKNMTSPRIPTPSAPMPAPSIPAVEVTGPREHPTRPRIKTGGFKWAVRTKKAPTISAPILPEGFVESLGMETFPLYPGVKHPQHSALSTALRQSQIPTLPQRAAASPDPDHRVPLARKATPGPKNALGRTNNTLPVRGGDRATSPSPPLSLHEEQPANRGVYSHSSLGLNRPAALSGSSTSGPSSSSSGGRAVSPAQEANHHARTASSTTAGSGFRDPWSAGSRTSMHSQRTHPSGNNSSYLQESERTSLASTVVDYDYRNGAPPTAGSTRQYSPVDVTPASPSPSPLDHVADDRHGSISSNYSEASEVPPRNDFHPSNAFRPTFTPSNAAGQLRKNSLAIGLPTLGTFAVGAHGRAAGSGPKSAGTGAAFVPIQPLNLARRPSHAYLRPAPADDPNRNTLAGDVVWGGLGVGGPRDVAFSPVPSGVASPVVAHAHLPTIGTTGFRNPFG
ncbi:hypothetical protein JCM3770_004848 [Rhodotorula araucariae]